MSNNKTNKKFSTIFIGFWITLFIAIILVIIIFTSLGGAFYTPSNHKQFSTQYTEQEHIDRISEETEKIIKSGWYKETKTKVVDYKVEIVYSFYDNDPEYFLVTLELDREASDPNANQYFIYNRTTKYRHILGFIIGDEYRYTKWFDYGKSIYDVLGYSNSKKYYGNNAFGVEIENDEILLLKDGVECKFPKINTGVSVRAPDSAEFNYYYHLEREIHLKGDTCYKQRVLTLEEQKDLMGWGCYDYELRDYKA